MLLQDAGHPFPPVITEAVLTLLGLRELERFASCFGCTSPELARTRQLARGLFAAGSLDGSELHELPAHSRQLAIALGLAAAAPFPQLELLENWATATWGVAQRQVPAPTATRQLCSGRWQHFGGPPWKTLKPTPADDWDRDHWLVWPTTGKFEVDILADNLVAPAVGLLIVATDPWFDDPDTFDDMCAFVAAELCNKMPLRPIYETLMAVGAEAAGVRITR